MAQPVPAPDAVVNQSPSPTVSANNSSQPSFRVGAVQHFLKHDTVKLTEGTYILWKHQVLLIIDGYGLLPYVSDSITPPNRFTSGQSGPVAENPDYISYNQQDKLLASWLLSTIHPDILPHLTGLNSSRAIWNAVSRLFGAKSSAKISALRHSLHSQRKGCLSVSEYLAKIKLICDTLRVSGNVISEQEHVSVVLAGLSPEFEAVISIASREFLTLDAITDMLLDCEARQKNFLTDNISIQANLVSKPNMIVTGGQSDTSIANLSQVQTPTDQAFVHFSRGGGNRGGNNYRGRGRERFNNNRPQCQLCGKFGHVVQKCYYRFDLSFKGQTQEEIQHGENQSYQYGYTTKEGLVNRFEGQAQVFNQQQTTASTGAQVQSQVGPIQAYNHVLQQQVSPFSSGVSPFSSGVYVSRPQFSAPIQHMEYGSSNYLAPAQHMGSGSLNATQPFTIMQQGVSQPFTNIQQGGSHVPIALQTNSQVSQVNGGSGDVSWYPDSGATHHITNDKSAIHKDSEYIVGGESHTGRTIQVSLDHQC